LISERQVDVNNLIIAAGNLRTEEEEEEEGDGDPG